MTFWKRAAILTMVVAAGLLAAQFVGAPSVAAQVRAALVRNVDEPARVPYFHSLSPTCPYANQCYVTFPAVPAGKRLHLTSIHVVFVGTNTNAFLWVNRNSTGNPLAAYTIAPTSAYFYGSQLATNQQVDLYFEAGEAPNLELGVSPVAEIVGTSLDKMSVSGYVVDILP